MTSTTSRGRPRAISRDMLQESAFELFLEQGYAATTIGDITQRAGVSRNTFFNYFTGKADVFWTDLESAFGALDAELSSAASNIEPMEAIRGAVLSAGAAFGPGRVPWALTQHSMIGATYELQASALTTITAQAESLRGFVLARTGDATLAAPAAYAVIGAVVAAARTWADAGTSRGELVPYLDAAVTPVCHAFGAALAASTSPGR